MPLSSGKPYNIALIDKDKCNNLIHSLLLLSSNLVKSILCFNNVMQASDEFNALKKGNSFPDIIIVDEAPPDVAELILEHISSNKILNKKETHLIYLTNKTNDFTSSQNQRYVHYCTKPLSKEKLTNILENKL